MAKYMIEPVGVEFNASQLGGCEHSQVLQLMGVKAPPYPAEMQALFKRALLNEDLVKSTLVINKVPMAFCDDSDRLRLALRDCMKVGDQEYALKINCVTDGVLFYETPWNDSCWRDSGYVPFKEPAKLHKQVAAFEHKYFSKASWDEFLVNELEQFPQYRFQLAIQQHCLQEYFELEYTPPIVFSVEQADCEEGKQPQRIYRIYEEPFYTKRKIFERCESIVRNWKMQYVPDCSNPKFCAY